MAQHVGSVDVAMNMIQASSHPQSWISASCSLIDSSADEQSKLDKYPTSIEEDYALFTGGNLVRHNYCLTLHWNAWQGCLLRLESNHDYLRMAMRNDIGITTYHKLFFYDGH